MQKKQKSIEVRSQSADEDINPIDINIKIYQHYQSKLAISIQHQVPKQLFAFCYVLITYLAEFAVECSVHTGLGYQTFCHFVIIKFSNGNKFFN